MNHICFKFGCVAVSLVFVACGGRVANPIAEKNSWDSQLSCSHLSGEYDNHEKRLVELTGERKDKPIHNVGMFLSSPLFLDLSKSQQFEATAIYKRQAHIKMIMNSKGCGDPEVSKERASSDSET